MSLRRCSTVAPFKAPVAPVMTIMRVFLSFPGALGAGRVVSMAAQERQEDVVDEMLDEWLVARLARDHDAVDDHGRYDLGEQFGGPGRHLFSVPDRLAQRLIC